MKKIVLSFFLGVFLSIVFVGCQEDIDDGNRYVFEKHTIMDYLKSHEQFSKYVVLLGQVPMSPISKTTPAQLLSARGNYTVFAPTNEAIAAYLDTLVAQGLIDYASWDAFRNQKTLDSVRQQIVYNSIIDGGDVIYFETSQFPQNNNEEFPLSTLADRKLSVYYGEGGSDTILLNNSIPISPTNRDILELNGVIHQVEGVVAPSNDDLSTILEEYIGGKRHGYSVVAKMVKAAGLFDTLSKIRDDRFELLYQTQDPRVADLPAHPTENKTGYIPMHRKYGYTLFAQKDEFWERTLGKPAQDITLADLRQYIVAQGYYPDARDDDDYENPANVLYQFITYHILPERIPADKLIIHYNEKGYLPANMTPTVAMTEHYTTMGQRRLLRIYESYESQGVYLNRFPKLDNGRHGSYHEVSCDPDKVGLYVDKDNADLSAVNAAIYPIDGVLAYDDHTRTNLQHTRIRYDVSSLLPEFMNNDIRGQTVISDRTMIVAMPTDVNYKYLDDVDISDETLFYYLMGRDNGWTNYLADEFNIVGRTDVTFRLPPVPKFGTYELRVAVQSNSNVRGMVQVYWGDKKDALPAAGIPLDVRMGGEVRQTSVGNFPSNVGWVLDTEDDDFNSEIDKKMRNKDFMKGPEHFISGSPGGTKTSRMEVNNLRRIMVRATMDPNKTYYMRFKTVLEQTDRQFFMDYIELCPKEVYDNPADPEDIW